MESEAAVPASSSSSLALPSKLDTANVFQAFHSFSQPSLAPFNSSYPSNPYSMHYPGSSNEMFDPKAMAMNAAQRSNLDNATLQSLQSRIVENKMANAQQQQQQDKLLAQQPSSSSSSSQLPQGVNVGGGPGTPSNTSHQFAYDERFHALYEREIRWNEVRRCVDLIRRVATDAAHMELTKDAFYDLYNLALLLLKSVDSLDPDKTKKSEGQYFPSQMSGGALTPSGTLVPSPMMPAQVADADLMQQQRKSYDMYGVRGGQSVGNAFDGTTYLGTMPKYAALPTDQTIYAYSQGQDGGMGVGAYAQSMQMGGAFAAQGGGFMKPSGGSTPTSAASEQKNFTGEVFFDDVSQGADGNRPKRQRRRRTVYSSRRNLHCHMCGVTETPEWRRGPAGDHTLCNACGLHYAKSLKKQRKERDTRKHSIDMLLNEQQQPAIPTNSNGANGNPLSTSPLNGNHSSPDSSHEDMTPPNELLPTN